MAQASQMLAWVSLGLGNDHFAPSLWLFVSGTEKQPSKPCVSLWPCTVTGGKHHNSISND